MFTEIRETTYSQLSVEKTVSISYLLRYFQDAATMHTAACGFPIDKLEADGIAWIILSTRLSLHKSIPLGKRIAVSTWTTGFGKVYGFRSFQVQDHLTGELYATADSVWVFWDFYKDRPAKIPDEIMAVYGEKHLRETCYIRREPTWSADEKVQSFRVLKRDIDSNHHMNNVKYVEYAMEVLEETDRPKELEIYYKHPAYYGNILSLYMLRQTDSILTELKNSDNETCCYVKFNL